MYPSSTKWWALFFLIVVMLGFVSAKFYPEEFGAFIKKITPEVPAELKDKMK